jgi:hypothetical protein
MCCRCIVGKWIELITFTIYWRGALDGTVVASAAQSGCIHLNNVTTLLPSVYEYGSFTTRTLPAWFIPRFSES